jgi:hypothetical protein
MDASLYVSNKRIQLVYGQVKGSHVEVAESTEVAMPPQAFLNGIVTDETAFRGAIEKIVTQSARPDLKDVRITIGSSPGILKTKEIPRIKPRLVWKWLEGEFTDEIGEGESMEDYLTDYSILDKGEEGDLALIAAVPRELIGQYIRIFDELNITISCIDSGMSSMIKMIHWLPATENKTVMALDIDGSLLTGTLFVNGVYRMYSRSRLLSDPDSESEAAEISQMESRMIQFNYTEKNPDPIEFLYLLGFSDRQKAFMNRDSSLKIRDINEDGAEVVTIADPAFSLDAHICAAGNLIRE